IGFILLLVVSDNALKRNLMQEKEARLAAVVDSTISQINALKKLYPEAEVFAIWILYSISFQPNFATYLRFLF
ncbi:hypothetical protein OAP63_17365, partial [Vibrio sp.]|nr:hypothetical protein [Vibrio sp.]